jgi:parvulin-like peptidyl-prolyl isomerase
MHLPKKNFLMRANQEFNTIRRATVKSNNIPAALILIAAVVAAACKSSASEDVVARVGSREITLKQIDSVIKQQLDASGSSPAALSPAELVGARLSVLDNLIQEEALFQKAKRDNLAPDDNKVNQEIQKRKQDAGLTEEQYQNQLKQTGLTEEDIKDKIRRELAINALKEREKARVAAPTEDDIKKYYEDHKAEFVAERGVDISIIATDPANNGAIDDAIGDAAAEQKIKAIYEQLKNGADFATIASQRSEDPSAIRAGNLGFASEAMLKQSFPTRPDIPERLMKMSPGQYTEPIKDNISGRWYIFKVNAKREQSQNLTLDSPEVRKSIVDIIIQQRQQILLNALLMVAMTETSIRNYLAERIVARPERIVEMRPSALLQQSRPQQAPQVENENRPASSNSTRKR